MYSICAEKKKKKDTSYCKNKTNKKNIQKKKNTKNPKNKNRDAQAWLLNVF